MLDVCLLGTGGMMPLPYRWLTALMTRCGGSDLLIDCGEGTQIALKEKGWSPKPIDTICFTHYHADHISGLPGLLLTMGNAERTEPLTLVGPRGLERVVNALRTIAPELPFPLRFIELTEPREQLKLGPYVIDAYRVNHNVVCYAMPFPSREPDASMWSAPGPWRSRRSCGAVCRKGKPSQKMGVPIRQIWSWGLRAAGLKSSTAPTPARSR